MCFLLVAVFSQSSLAVPIIYEVSRLRDGNNFSTRRVDARQKGKTMFTLFASFQVFHYASLCFITTKKTYLVTSLGYYRESNRVLITRSRTCLICYLLKRWTFSPCFEAYNRLVDYCHFYLLQLVSRDEMLQRRMTDHLLPRFCARAIIQRR